MKIAVFFLSAACAAALMGCGQVGESLLLGGGRTYMAEARILIRPDAGVEEPIMAQTTGVKHRDHFLRTQMEIIKSKPVLYEVIENLHFQKTWGASYGDGAPLSRADAWQILFDSLEVDRFRDTDLVAIKVYRDDPEEAARLANEVAQVYREQRLQLKRREVKRAIDALKGELQKQQDHVNEAEAEVERIRETLGVRSLVTVLGPDRIAQLEADLVDARVEMHTRKTRFEKLEELEGEEFMAAIALLVPRADLTSLRDKLDEMEVSLELARRDYGEDHPETTRLVAARERLTTRLGQRIAGLKKGLRVDHEVAHAKYRALQSEVRAIKEGSVAQESGPLARAERQLKIQRAILDALRARIAQEGIELEVPRTSVEIVDPADPPMRRVRR